jgi:hypothetical protein
MTVDSIALDSGQSRTSVERLLTLLQRAGLVSLRHGLLNVNLPQPAFGKKLARIRTEVQFVRDHDASRVQRLSQYALGVSCRASALAAYFDSGSSEPCGVCSVCTTSGSILEGEAPPTRRRAAPHRFSIGDHDSRHAAGQQDRRESKVGDWVVV